ncbi:amidase [Halomonas sp. ML-15]|nr:amidase [Halomonas sp. ML-15]
MHKSLRKGKIKSSDLIRNAIENYNKYEKYHNAYKTWKGEDTLLLAESVDKVFASGGDAGILMGIPISVKDIYGVPGFPTYAGSYAPLPEPWEKAGPIIKSLQNQLSCIVGKTHAVEFAFGGLGPNEHWGTPRNPWDNKTHRITGGSSSGAGVSLINGTALIALGTDTAGSIRVPASMTGVAGIKTTIGRWPTEKIVPLSTTLDTPGLLAKNVDDLAFAFESLDQQFAKKMRKIPCKPSLSDITFGVPDQFFWDGCEPGIYETIEQAILILESAGARIVKLNLPGADEAYSIFKLGGLATSELSSFLNSELPDRIAWLDSNIASRIKAADDTPAREYIQRLNSLKKLSLSADNSLCKVDAFLTPTVAISPPSLDSLKSAENYKAANVLALRNTVISNFMSLCAITLPAGKDSNGMPVGLQLMGRSWNDAKLLAIGQSVEDKIGTSRALLGHIPSEIKI